MFVCLNVLVFLSFCVFCVFRVSNSTVILCLCVSVCPYWCLSVSSVFLLVFDLVSLLRLLVSGLFTDFDDVTGT